jgi:Zn-dependent protease with chaperone function
MVGAMPTAAPDHRRDFLKVLVLPALTFLLIPILAAGFARYGAGRIDADIQAAVERAIDRDAKVPAAEKPAIKAEWRSHPASSVCDAEGEEAARLREAVCGRFGEVWQFRWAWRLGVLSALLGLGAFAAIGLLGYVAWRDRRAQYWSFMLGWRALILVTAVETVVQGALAVWLSYWVTALLFERYYLKLIVVAGLLALGAVAAIVMGLVKRPPEGEPLEAEQLREADAPGLWGRVRQLAVRLGATPPTAIVAGIDDNFFVTEQATRLAGGEAVDGRVLFVSLPLLRVLEPSEADAIFGHELAHFHGGDTAASARLAPELRRFHAYWSSLAEGGLTAPASYVMRLYRAVFELALAREQRRREFQADAEAARLTSPDDLARSLVKVTGYSSFRAHTERALFDARAVHEEGLSLRRRIDDGLAAHAASQGFLEALATHEVPHPFDTHPPLLERMAAVRAQVSPEEAAALLEARPARTWADEVLTGAAVEERLWGAYEARFQEQHQASLAWRYLPATEAERAHVLRYFPDLDFPQKDGKALRITHAALTLAEGEVVAFAEIEKAQVQEETLTHRLTLTLRDAGAGTRKVKVNLRPLGKAAGAFKAAFGKYWQRDQVARRSAQEG